MLYFYFDLVLNPFVIRVVLLLRIYLTLMTTSTPESPPWFSGSFVSGTAPEAQEKVKFLSVMISCVICITEHP